MRSVRGDTKTTPGHDGGVGRVGRGVPGSRQYGVDLCVDCVATASEVLEGLPD